MRRAWSFLASFALLEALWALLVGTRQPTELVAGLIAAGLGALFAERLRSLGLLEGVPDLRLLARAWKLPWQIVFDFGVVTWVLVRSLLRGQRVRGQWVRAPFIAGDGPVGTWRRAFVAVAGTMTPNAIVVDVDHDQALMHSLEPRVATGSEPL